MALSPQLLQFKSSGVYRLEFDKSITSNINVETLRLIVGHSRKGPYNTPVLVSTIEEFTNVFGSIDRKLEKKGMFFHRSAMEALSRGPILALNASSFGTTDRGYYQRPVTNGSVDSIVSSAGDKDYTDFFDMDKFMNPSDTRVLNSLEVAGEDSNQAINFVNIKQSAITVFVRKAQSVKEFDITAREWYGEGNVPEFMNDFDYISDFMVDIFVFKGNFDTATASIDPVYGAYFDANGLKKDKLAEFANLKQVTLDAQYTGSLIPGFKDLEGRNLYVESMINSESRRTGLFCAINEDAITNDAGTKLDLVGHTFDADQDYELLSYSIAQNVQETVVSLPAGITPTATTITTQNPTQGNGTQAFDIIGEDRTADITTDDFIIDGDGNYAQITSITFANGNTTVASTNIVNGLDVQYQASQSFNIYDSALVPAATVAYGTLGSTTLEFTNFDATTAFAEGDFLAADVAGEYVEILAVTQTGIVAEGAISASYDGLTGLVDISKYAVSQGRVIAEEFSGATYLASGSLFTLTYGAGLAPASIALSVGDYVPALESNRLARVKRIAKSGDVYTVYCDVPVTAAWAGAFLLSFEDATEVYKPFALSGAKLDDKSIQESLSVLNGGNGLHAALIDKDVIDFRYVVDTFASYDENGLQNKTELSFLAKARQNAAAILNAPTVADFKASSNPTFKDDEGTFKVEYIATGGNLDKNPTSLYSLPGINAGANYAFYYGPGLIVSDNGKDLIVPPAAYVSNNYIDKYTNATPWSIIAGPRRGVVGGTGVKGAEYAFDKNDRDVLEPFGINPIVFQRGVGLTILGNKTAQQSVKSALSSAHVREALIYIQEGMAAILKDYVFEFNNTQTRLEIKTLADSFMESVKADGGVYAFKNTMDQTNNTDDVIDNNIGVIDTYVEPVKGLEIVVHRTTILNTGEIETGNFN